MTEPRSRPILMSAPMIRALLDGRKVQTRRIVKPQPTGEPRPLSEWSQGLAATCGDGSPDPEKLAAHTAGLKGRISPFTNESGLYSPPCPFGRPGDELWVKEALRRNREPDEKDDEGRPIYFCRYTATPDVLCGFWSPLMILGGFHHQPRGYTVSPIHMPRAYSRITLRITDVRVERLCEISAADAIAEGCPAVPLHSLDCDSVSPVVQFRKLWESIHGPESWSKSPWVWVISFERVTP